MVYFHQLRKIKSAVKQKGESGFLVSSRGVNDILCNGQEREGFHLYKNLRIQFSDLLPWVHNFDYEKTCHLSFSVV